MKNIIGIVSADNGYAGKLAVYISSKKDFAFYGGAFTCLKQAYEFGLEKKFSVLLIDSGLLSVTDGSLEELKVIWGVTEDILILKADKNTETQLPFRSIYKYVSAERIIQEISDCRRSDESNKQKTEKESFSVMFAASGRPVGRRQLEHMAELKKDKKLFFICCSPFCDGNPGLSDAYFSFANGKNTGIAQYFKEEKGYYRLSGLNFFEELSSMTSEVLQSMASCCVAESCFGEVVFVIENISKTSLELMEKAENIYSVVWKGEEEEARQSEFLRQLKYAGLESMLDKITEFGGDDVE